LRRRPPEPNLTHHEKPYSVLYSLPVHDPVSRGDKNRN
jgi:hypothetical protein